MMHNPVIKYRILLLKGSNNDGSEVELETTLEDLEEDCISSMLIEQGYFKAMAWPSDYYRVLSREVYL